MSLGAQIKSARAAMDKMKQSELADKIGVSQGTIADWESDRTKPRLDKLAALSKVLEVSFTMNDENDGGGEVFEYNPQFPKIPNRRAASDQPPEARKRPANDIIEVPEYDIRLSAGGGFVVDKETIRDMWVFSTSYINQMRLGSATLLVAEVEGDSMEPKLESGDRVMINLSDKDANRPGIFAIWDTTALVVKRIEKIPGTDPVMLRLISDNPNHSKYDVLAEETRIIGRVVWFARRI